MQPGTAAEALALHDISCVLQAHRPLAGGLDCAICDLAPPRESGQSPVPVESLLELR